LCLGSLIKMADMHPIDAYAALQAGKELNFTRVPDPVTTVNELASKTDVPHHEYKSPKPTEIKGTRWR
jgi:hypothetical protein